MDGDRIGIRAVSMLPRVKVVEGFYTKHKIRMPFYKEPCISCDKTDGMASVVKLEEKRSDVTFPPSASYPRRFRLGRTAISFVVPRRGSRDAPEPPMG